MVAPFNQTLVENSTSLLPIAQAIGEWSDGLLGYVLIGVVAIVMFMATSRQDTKTAFLVVSFISMLSSGMLFVLELVNMATVGVTIALFVATMLFYMLTTD